MSLLIQSTCVNCDMCLPECPNEAIVVGAEIYEILPQLCTECVGFYDQPQCQKVCPIDKCIVLDENNIESEQSLWQKFAQLENILSSTS